ncbi:SsrA-binding protein [Lutibacter holmesii]|uniref:SsrA-binding protein n=1 Tax=Lutibacter holmesii TaxID=1137985 RepID=A0ABW3WN11_9FLAO
MKKNLFIFIAKLNALLLPSFTKRGLDMAYAKKWQLAIIGWRYFITKNSL